MDSTTDSMKENCTERPLCKVESHKKRDECDSKGPLLDWATSQEGADVYDKATSFHFLPNLPPASLRGHNFLEGKEGQEKHV